MPLPVTSEEFGSLDNSSCEGELLWSAIEVRLMTLPVLDNGDYQDDGTIEKAAATGLRCGKGK